MKLKPIITSLLQNDAYKFNMGNVIFLKFNDKVTKWRFKNRTKNVHFTPEMIQEIREQIDYMCTLHFTDDELNYLRKNFPWLSTGYINFLKYFQLDRNEIKINEGNIHSLKIITNAALGFIAFSIGGEFKLTTLKKLGKSFLNFP